MEDSDLDNLRNTPGFKPILRAILKSQMKHLVEQLSRHGGEEAMLLTASVTDASFNHLGSTLTEGFLDSRKEIKNQFLVHCMKGSQENKDQNEKVSPGTRPKNSRRASIISPVSLIKVVPEPGDGTNIQATGVAKEGATFSSQKSMKNGRKRPGAAMSSYTPPKRASISETVTQALQAISAETEHEMEGETVGSLKVESDHDDPDYTPNENADSSDTLSLDLGTGTKERHDRMKEFSDNEQSGPKFDLDACDPEKVKVEPGDDVDESKDQSDLDVNTGAAVDGEGATETVTKTGETNSRSFDVVRNEDREKGIATSVSVQQSRLKPRKRRSEMVVPADLKCTICDRIYQSRDTYLRHHKRHTQQYYCRCCSQAFPDKETLTQHKAVHKRAFLCNICGKEIIGRHSFVNHTNLHNNAKIFICPYKDCGMKFLYGRKLSDHLNTHLGSKPYQCERCEAAFATSSSLSRHKGECGKMIQCMDCGQEFSGRSSLADHMRSVHVDLPYDCVCGKRFKWRTNLSRHKKQCPFHFKPNLSFAIEDGADEDDA